MTSVKPPWCVSEASDSVPSPSSDTKLCSAEADAAVKEVGFGVKEILLAAKDLPCTDSLAYINLTTLEGESMCVEVSCKGFAPVGESYDQTSGLDCHEPQHYETIYALLSTRSAMFRDKFSQRLCDKLTDLQKPLQSDLD
ncbi:unnamed protein product [Dicrocoelium dendriticum]|nr:unnamed protein product [Dicrocoelium dendriticum]